MLSFLSPLPLPRTRVRGRLHPVHPWDDPKHCKNHVLVLLMDEVHYAHFRLVFVRVHFGSISENLIAGFFCCLGRDSIHFVRKRGVFHTQTYRARHFFYYFFPFSVMSF